MPDLNEFFKPERIMATELEKIGGVKPCKSCDKDSSEYYWNALTLEMTWECPSGHKNSYRIN